MNHYEQKQEEKRERLEAAAEKARQKSDGLYKAAMQKADAIPMGQPMLVGHHSYKRDRNFRERMHNQFMKSHEEAERAKDLARRAEAVGTGGISSDDPEAVVKLIEQLEPLEARRDRMKKANALYRKTKGDREAKVEAVRAAGILSTDEWAEYRTTLALCPYQVEKCIFPSYAITNLGANIRRIQERIEHLRKLAETPAAPDIEGPGYRIVDNAEANRTQVIFEKRCSDECYRELKMFGFRWCPSEGAFQRHRSGGAAHWAKSLCERFYPAASQPAVETPKPTCGCPVNAPEADPDKWPCPCGEHCQDPECKQEGAMKP